MTRKASLAYLVTIPLSVCIAAGLLLFVLASESDPERYARVERIEVGMMMADVKALVGEPDAICDEVRSVGHLLPVIPLPERRTIRRRLAERTEVIWVYSSGSPIECRGEYNDSEIGFNERGEVIWIMAAVGESTLIFDD